MSKGVYFSLPSSVVLNLVSKRKMSKKNLINFFKTFDEESLYKLQNDSESIADDYHQAKVECAIEDAQDALFDDLKLKYKVEEFFLDNIEGLYVNCAIEPNVIKLINVLKELTKLEICLLLELCVIKNNKILYDLILSADEHNNFMLVKDIILCVADTAVSEKTFTYEQLWVVKNQLLKFGHKELDNILALVTTILKDCDEKYESGTLPQWVEFKEIYENKEQIWYDNVKNKVYRRN